MLISPTPFDSFTRWIPDGLTLGYRQGASVAWTPNYVIHYPNTFICLSYRNPGFPVGFIEHEMFRYNGNKKSSHLVAGRHPKHQQKGIFTSLPRIIKPTQMSAFIPSFRINMRN